MRKLVGWLFAAVVLMAGVGCTTSHPNPSSTGATAKVSPETATTVHASSGLTVTIPAHAVAGPGTVTVSPVTRDGQSGWHVDLTGTTLTAPATLTFPGTPQAGEPAPLVTYATTADGPLSLADGVQLGAGGASVSTTHFSFWFVTWWSSLMGKVNAAWEQVMAPSGTGAAPTCTGSDQLKASGPVVAASTDDRVAWCAGLSPAGKPRVSVVNARGYPMSVLATSHMVLTNQDQSWQSAFAQLMSTLGHGTAPAGMSRDVLPPGAGYTYDDTGSDTQGVQVTADGAAYVANALLYSIDTILFAADASGQHTTMLEVVKGFADTSECFSSGRDLFSAQVTSLDQATSVTVSAIEAWSGCLGKVMEKVYDDHDGLTMLSGAIWLVSGAKQLIAAGEVVKDAFALSGKPFTITLTPRPSVSTGPSASALASITAPPMCERPATPLVDGKIPGLSDTEGGTELVKDTSGAVRALTGPFGPGGVSATVVAFICSAGGVAWPQVLGLYDETLTLKGSIDLGQIDQQTESAVTAMAVHGNVLHLQWLTSDNCHPLAELPIPRSADFTLSGSWQPTMSNLVTGPATSPCDL